MDVIELPNGKYKVKKAYLDKNFIGIMPQKIFWMNEDDEGYVTISKYDMYKMVRDKTTKEERERVLYSCASLNNKGMEYEKEGNILEAIKVYEENISGDNPYPSRHSFGRLMILYRKQKDYKNEIRVIKKALKVFKEEQDRDKYSTRLEKAKQLNSKSSKAKPKATKPKISKPSNKPISILGGWFG